MNALLAKELRQILPAQLFVAALFALAGWATLDPHEVLAPYDENQGWLHMVVGALCFAEGLVLAYGQFASERWQGTEAYLVHRSTGRAGAFQAKVLAGLLALLALVLVPAAAFGAVHLSAHPFAGAESWLRLAKVAMASSTAFVGYAHGALATHLGRTILARVGFATLGTASISVALTLVLLPWTVVPLSMAGRMALFVLASTACLLWSARHVFVGNETRKAGDARVPAFAFASVAASLCLPPLALAPFFGLTWAVTSFEADAPEVVVDDRGELYVATPTDRDRRPLWETDRELPAWGRVYEIVDLDGVPVPDERALHYAGWSGSDEPFEMVFDASFLDDLPLGEPRRLESWLGGGLPFELSDPWISRRVNNYTWCLNRSSGEHWIRRHSSAIGYTYNDPETAWRRLDPRTPDVQVVYGLSRMGGAAFLLFETDQSRFLKLVAAEERGGPSLVEAPLPDGDRFVQMDWLYGERQAQLGLGLARRVLVRGERDRYVWNGLAWTRWSEVEDLDRMGLATLEEARQLHRWSLEAEPGHGLDYRVSILDADSGQRLVELDVVARSTAQQRSEWLATASCLALPPLVAVRSWLQPIRGPSGPLTFAFGTAEANALSGQRRTAVVVALVVLALWLVRDLGKRLARRGAPVERRVLWCLLTAVFGLPAYVLARTVERSERPLPNRASPSAEPRANPLVIVTA